ncbi:MAG: hypothetical protein U0354_01295 [Candidatus Sericytochromatia bacterium]
MKKIFYTLLFSLLLINTSFSVEQGMIEYQIKSELFMKRLIVGNMNEAYDLLFIGSPLKANPKNLITLKNTNKLIIEQYGKPLSFDFVKQNKYPNNRVSVQYLLKSEKFPLIWEFHYYKPKNEWIITKINFL